jgi:hypothetical protein
MCHAAQNTEDKREKIHALALAKVKSSNISRGDKEESNESDYNEDKDSWKKSRKRKQER